MISEDGEFVLCSKPGCTAKHKNHRWGYIKAEGWFHQKNGDAWCPDHIPAWVKKWRKENA